MYKILPFTHFRKNKIISDSKFVTMRSGIIRLILLEVILTMLSACYYDNDLELYPSYTESNCDTLNMSYNANVVPILSERCYACHASSIALGNIILDSHSAVLTHVNSGAFVGAISHDPSYSPMPKGGAKLSPCSEKKIKAWIEQGALNN